MTNSEHQPVNLYSIEEEEYRNQPKVVIINKSLWGANPLGMWSFALMIAGVITSIIPFMGIFAFFLLPVSLILGIISLVKRRKPKWPAIIGISVSLVTMIINTIIFMIYVALGVTAIWGIFSGLPEFINQL
jgi:hypothetical protein